ncbi:hypothetical protein WDU94_007336 [Cyamophila willieti]
MEAESQLLLVARAIDEKIKYIETKLERPYLIGFNHNNTPAQEAEKILDNFTKEVDDMIDEQQEIEKFLEDENKEVQASNEDYRKFLLESQSQLEEMEQYACKNVPGYKKFVPPPPPPTAVDVLTSPSDLPITFLSEPIDRDELALEEENDNIPSEDHADHLDIKQEENHVEEDLYEQKQPEEELFQDDSHVLVPDESQIDLVSSPIMDIKPVVAKKLDFDQLSSGLIKGQPMACSTERKSKTPVEAVQKKRALQKQSEDIENLSGIQDIGDPRVKQPPPPSSYQSKPTRKILTERQISDNSHRSVETIKQTRDKESHGVKESFNPYSKQSQNVPRPVASKDYIPQNKDAEKVRKETRDAKTKDFSPSYTSSKDSTKDLPPSFNSQDFLASLSNKYFPTSSTNFRRDTLSGRSVPSSDVLRTLGARNEAASDAALRRDTLGGRKDFALPALSDVLRRDTLSGKTLPSGVRRDTLTGRKDFLPGMEVKVGERRDTLGGRKELPGLPSGLRDGYSRDTFGGRKDFPTSLRDGFSSRDTFGGRKELPTGLRDGYSRDTFGGLKDNLPTGLRDGTHRDTLTGEVISSRRLSHYRAVPKMRFGTLPSPPKEPVTSELGLKMIGRLK